MERFTNINIKSNDKTFTYLISYMQCVSPIHNDHGFGIYMFNNDLCLMNEQSNINRNKGVWTTRNLTENISYKYIPDEYKTAKIRLYFPEFSLDKLTTTKYAFDICTYIRGDKIILGSYLFSNIDTLATSVIKRGEHKYCEYIEFDIIDPYYITYSDDWKIFREELCDEYPVVYPGMHFRLNNECPTLYFSLYPVISEDNNTYITKKQYSGGQNSLNIDDPDYLSINLRPFFDSEGPIKIVGNFEYNNEYSDLFTYIMETYDIWDYFILPDIKNPCGETIDPLYIGLPFGFGTDDLCFNDQIKLKELIVCPIPDSRYQTGELSTKTYLHIHDIVRGLSDVNQFFDIKDICNDSTPSEKTNDLCFDGELKMGDIISREIEDPEYQASVISHADDLLTCNICLPENINIKNIIGGPVNEYEYQIGTEPVRTNFPVSDIKDFHLHMPSMYFEMIISDKQTILWSTGKIPLDRECIDIDMSNICLNWSDFKEGLFIAGYAKVYDKKGHGIIIRSNKIPVTQELFRYFVGCEKDKIFNIDFNKNTIKDMEIFNINAVNKIVNQVVYMENKEDAKSNIIQPIFFRTSPLPNLIIHSAITENICINLDAYKSKVKKFAIQVGGKKFIEIGRISAGVIFKIQGSLLNKELTEGTYYIINESSDVVSTGKYKYEY